MRTIRRLTYLSRSARLPDVNGMKQNVGQLYDCKLATCWWVLKGDRDIKEILGYDPYQNAESDPFQEFDIFVEPWVYDGIVQYINCGGWAGLSLYEFLMKISSNVDDPDCLARR